MTNLLDPGTWNFWGSQIKTPADYQTLDTRRKIALAMLAQGGRKGYPKTLGEGLTAIGDALGERGQIAALERAQAAFQEQSAKDAPSLVPGGAAPAAAPGPQAALTPSAAVEPDTATKQLTASAAPPEEGGYNFIDAQAGGRFGPTPGYLQDAIAAREPDPDMQAYYGALSGKEARNAQDVSPTGAAGPFQFTRGTGARYGIPGAARMDPGASTDAVRALTADNAAAFQAKNGRPPTFQELAIMHQQGAGGGMALMAGRPAPAGNLAVNNMAGFSPGAAVAKMNRFYGMPGDTANVGGTAAPDTSVADARGVARLSDVVGMEKGDTGAYAQTASRGDIQSDAPEAGLTGASSQTGAAAADTMMQAREQLAKRLLQQQQQPLLPPTPAPAPAMTGAAPASQPDIAPVPAAPIPVAGAQLAQATLPQQQPTPPTSEPKLPPNEPIHPDEARGYKMLAAHPDPNDPYNAAAQNLVKYGATIRAKQDADNMEKYRLQYQTWQARSNPQAISEAAIKSQEADVAKRFGGAVPYQQFVADMSKSYDATQQLANTLPTFRQAKQALAQSYVGSGAEIKLDANKMLRALGVPGDYTPAVATELLQSRMKAIAGGLIKSTVGSQNISDADREFVEKAYSGTIKMEPESLRRLLGVAEDTTIRSINRHNDRLLSVASDPTKDTALRNQYSVPMQYGDAAVSYLKAHPDTANQFDEKFGKGHAKAVLQGMSYGQQ